jgi:hypothetical protein
MCLGRGARFAADHTLVLLINSLCYNKWEPVTAGALGAQTVCLPRPKLTLCSLAQGFFVIDFLSQRERGQKEGDYVEREEGSDSKQSSR